MAGGFDPRVVENVEHFAELEMLAQELGLDDTDVVFMQSPSDSKKNQLLTTSNALLYTPSGEHFGIVPIEGESLSNGQQNNHDLELFSSNVLWPSRHCCQ